MTVAQLGALLDAEFPQHKPEQGSVTDLLAWKQLAG